MHAIAAAGVAGSTDTMKALVRHGYGTADVLRLEEVDKPRIGDHEVLARVRAAGVARSAWHLMTGLPYLVRVVGYGLRAPKNPVLGSEFAGVVEAPPLTNAQSLDRLAEVAPVVAFSRILFLTGIGPAPPD